MSVSSSATIETWTGEVKGVRGLKLQETLYHKLEVWAAEPSN